MQNRAAVGSYKKDLFVLLEPSLHHSDRVVDDRYGAEFELSAIVRLLDLCPLRILSFQRDRCARNGQVLRIVNHASHRAENRGLQRCHFPQTENNYSESHRAHRPPLVASAPLVGRSESSASCQEKRSGNDLCVLLRYALCCRRRG